MSHPFDDEFNALNDDDAWWSRLSGPSTERMRLRELLAAHPEYDCRAIGPLNDTQVRTHLAELRRIDQRAKRVEDRARPSVQPTVEEPVAAATGATIILKSEVDKKKYGVMKLMLVAGAKTSVSCAVKAGVPPDKKEADAGDFCFAPGPQLDETSWQLDEARTDPVKISCEISDPQTVISKGKLQLFRFLSDTPVWERVLTSAELKQGTNTLKFNDVDEWTGKVAANADFPDGYLTSEHSPYTLKVIVEGAGECISPAVETRFNVMIHEVALELGARETLPKDKPAAALRHGSHRDLYDTLGGTLPTLGVTRKVEIIGNLFKTDSNEMYSNAAFDLHEEQWEQGPLIPVFAKLKTRTSSGIAAFSPLALGNVKCLWDWEDVSEDTSKLDVEPGHFVTQALNYDVKKTRPQGDNCHRLHGGKRTGDGKTDAVFPAQAGYGAADALEDAKFPFKVEAASTRTWSAFSLPWRKGKLASMTGVLFQPSRMAGDGYKIACYVAAPKALDGKIPVDIEEDLKGKKVSKGETGHFQIWRKHTVSRYVKKKNFAMNIPVAAVQAYYEKAYVNLDVQYKNIEFMDAATYNGAVAACVAGFDVFAQSAVDPTVDQHATGDCCVTYRSYDDFKTTLRGALGLSLAQFNTWLAGSGDDFNAVDKYVKLCSNKWGFAILKAVCNTQLPHIDGVTMCQFVGVHNIGEGGNLNGYAADLPSATRQRAAFITCAKADAYSGPGNSNTLQQTTAHEIGHHLFMPHAPDGYNIGGPAPNMHDKDDHNCTMSYNFSAERRWCGFCILRLRGWDKTALDKDGTKNSHS